MSTTSREAMAFRAAQPPYPTHDYAGSSKARQEVGLPGHCERCAEMGHVRAHRNLGCGDVGCTRRHDEDDPCDTPTRGDPMSDTTCLLLAAPGLAALLGTTLVDPEGAWRPIYDGFMRVVEWLRWPR